MTIDFTARLGDRYELTGVLGRGGMADVHRATDTVLGREVAVKMLRNVAEADERERFLAEGRLLAGLSHPGLVTLLDVGFDDDRPFLVMELVDGTTLANRIASGPAAPDEAATIGAALADALAAAHAAGVVHRDVKPDNVLLSQDGRVLLSDFGIARLAGDSARYTAPGTAVGTAAYLAPEQVKGDDVGTEADIYALGLVLLELLTGVRAFPGSAVEAAVARTVADPWIPDDVPVPWQRLLRRMTAREPFLRPSADEVARLLRWEETDTATATMQVVDAAPPVIHAARWIKIAALVSMVGLFLGGLVLAGQQVRQRPVDSGVPEVATSLQVMLDDLHAEVSALDSSFGVGPLLDRVDRALVDRKYVEARRALRALIAAVATAGAGDAGEAVVASAQRLLGVLPRPAPKVEENQEPEPASGTTGNPEPSGHPGKGKGGDPGKGKGKGKGH